MAPSPTPRPLSDAELAQLQDLLDALPAPFEPLDISALDGYLVGVLLQPQRIPLAQWLPRVHDIEGRPAPPGRALERLHGLVQRRHAELDGAIGQRQWFDPWVFELDEDASPSQAVLPWVAGFAAAMDHFPALLRHDGQALLEPLAVLYAHLDPDDLDDADDLLAEIETLEPASTLAEAVEDLVRSSLLIADVSRPRAPTARAPSPRRPASGRPRR